MAKLYFRYGAMGAAKSLNLLAVAHNYRRQGKKVYLIKPAADDRDGCGRAITSRTGLQADADLVLGPGDSMSRSDLDGVDCVLVDEAQFLSAGQVNMLRRLSVEADVPVICYGLRADFQSNLFPGSRRLMEVADTIEEVKTTCQYCCRKATQNLRLVGGSAQVLVGGDDAYAPACWRCFSERRGCV